MFGYYFEVTNSFKSLVPDYFIRKQTLTNAERYTTDELKELEDIIMGAEEKLVSLEYDLFCQVRDEIASQVVRIQKTAKAIAGIDVFCSLSAVASRHNYVKPAINEKGVIQIKNGRHPVVEQMMRDDLFVANDTFLDNGKNRLSVITGPNMAGKSTYMRQVALIVLMAQLGSFCAGPGGGYRHLRPDFHPGGGVGRFGQRPEHLHGGDDRGCQYPAQCHKTQPSGPG